MPIQSDDYGALHIIDMKVLFVVKGHRLHIPTTNEWTVLKCDIIRNNNDEGEMSKVAAFDVLVDGDLVLHYRGVNYLYEWKLVVRDERTDL